MNKPTPLLEFNVFPGLKEYSITDGVSSVKKVGKRGFYFKVFLFKDNKDLHQMEKAMMATFIDEFPSGASTLAYTKMKVDKNGRSHTSSEIGSILLSVDELSSEVVAHESTHAVFRWLFAKKHAIKLAQLICSYAQDKEGTIGEAEEVFAYAVGTTTQQIINHLYKEGFQYA